MVRAFQDAGYATGHFGKWHLGGGRDVGYAVGTTAGTTVTAPRVVEYGYDQAWTQMEGLGNRIINVVNYGGNADGTTTRPSDYFNGLNQASEARGTGNGQDQLVYLERQFNADFIANRTIEFIDDSVPQIPISRSSSTIGRTKFTPSMIRRLSTKTNTTPSIRVYRSTSETIWPA